MLIQGSEMVDKAIELAANVVKFAPRSCKPGDMVVVTVCFLAIGLLSGFFLGSYIAN